jgi:hypothetical protein
MSLSRSIIYGVAALGLLAGSALADERFLGSDTEAYYTYAVPQDSAAYDPLGEVNPQ